MSLTCSTVPRVASRTTAWNFLSSHVDPVQKLMSKLMCSGNRENGWKAFPGEGRSANCFKKCGSCDHSSRQSGSENRSTARRSKFRETVMLTWVSLSLALLANTLPTEPMGCAVRHRPPCSATRETPKGASKVSSLSPSNVIGLHSEGKTPLRRSSWNEGRAQRLMDTFLNTKPLMPNNKLVTPLQTPQGPSFLCPSTLLFPSFSPWLPALLINSSFLVESSSIWGSSDGRST